MLFLKNNKHRALVLDCFLKKPDVFSIKEGRGFCIEIIRELVDEN